MVVRCGFCGAEQAPRPADLHGSAVVRCDDCGLAVSSEVPDLAPSDEEMSYDLSPWATADRLTLRSMLVDRDVPFRWEADLVLAVHENDVVLVEQVLDLLDDLEPAEESLELEPAASPEDEAAAHAAMDELFLVADRLARDPADELRLVRLGELAEEVAALGPPYGIEVQLWDRVRRVTDRVTDQARAAGATEAGAEETGAKAGDDEAESPVAVAARDLRDLLRPYV